MSPVEFWSIGVPLSLVLAGIVIFCYVRNGRKLGMQFDND